MSAIQTELQLHLGAIGPAGRSVRIESPPPLPLMRVLEGRTAEQALRTVPLLFGVCAHAHRAAAADALSAALDDTLPQRAAMHRLVRLESLREHLLQVHGAWTSVQAPQGASTLAAEALSLVQAACARVEETPRLAAWVERNTLGMPAARWLELDELAGLRAWARGHRGDAARLVSRLLRQSGDVRLECLGTVEHADLHALREQLQGERFGEFAREPSLAGQCLETGPAARWREHPLVLACARHGLLGRFVARLLDLAGCLQELVANAPPPGASGPCGTAWVDCARGRLVHQAELDARGRVLRYAIVAPTQWNMHPRGLCSRLLAGIGDGTSDTIRQEARMVMLAVDPCVPTRLHLSQEHTEAPTSHA